MSQRRAVETESGKLRIRFERIAERLGRLSVDIAHKRSGDVSYHLHPDRVAPSTGDFGCFLFDELELLKTTDTSASYRKLHGQLLPLVRTLPQLLHHQSQVVEILVKHIVDTPNKKELDSTFSLMAVLTRDLGESTWTSFSSLMDGMTAITQEVAMSGGDRIEHKNISNPELTAKLFETMSYVFRACRRNLIATPERMSKYYGKLLTSPTTFVRDFAARAFSTILKAVSTPVFTKHIEKLINIAAKNCNAVDVAAMHDLISSGEAGLEDESAEMTQLLDMLDGISLLLVYSWKGIKGQMHSKALSKMKSLLCSCYEDATSDQRQTISDNRMIIFAAALTSATNRLQKHLDGDKSFELFAFIVVLLKELTSSMNETIPSSSQEQLTSAAITYIALVNLVNVSIANKRKSWSQESGMITISNDVVALVSDLCKAVFAVRWDESQKLQRKCLEVAKNLALAAIKAFSPHVNDLNYLSDVLFRGISQSVRPIEWTLDFLHQLKLHHIPERHENSIIYNGLLRVLTHVRTWIASEQWLAGVLTSLHLLSDPRVSPMPLAYEHLLKPTDAGTHSHLQLIKLMDIALAELEELVTKRYHIFTTQGKALEPERQLAAIAVKIMSWLVVNDTEPRLKAHTAQLVKQLMGAVEVKECSPESLQLMAILHVKALVGFDGYSYVSMILDRLVVSPLSISLSGAAVAILAALRDASAAKAAILTWIERGENREKFNASISLGLMSPSVWIRLHYLNVLHHTSWAVHVRHAPNAGMEQEEPVDISAALLEILCLPVGLATEREIARRIEGLEVLSRLESLSTENLRIIAAFCLGYLYIKFKPLWKSIINVLVVIASRNDGEDLLWPLLAKQLEKFRDIRSEESQAESLAADTRNALVRQQTLDHLDHGEDMLPEAIQESEVFLWKVAARSPGQVAWDDRCDRETYFANLIEILKLSPQITLKRSKVVVPEFMRFLTDVYYAAFAMDPEVSSLSSLGIVDVGLLPGHPHHVSTTTRKHIRARLRIYLQAFSQIKSPRQLYQHKVLYALYWELLASPDSSIAKLATDCIFTFKPPELLAYKSNIYNLFDDKLFRNELVTFDFASQHGEEVAVKEDDKPVLSLFLIRLLYGRTRTNASGRLLDKHWGKSRLSAVLNFILPMDHVAIQQYVYLHYRELYFLAEEHGDAPTKAFTSLSNDLRSIYDHIKAMAALVGSSIPTWTWSVTSNAGWMKFLHFVEALHVTVRTLAAAFEPQLLPACGVLLSIFFHADGVCASSTDAKEGEGQATEEGDDVMDAEEPLETASVVSASAKANPRSVFRLRTACIQCMGGIVDHFHHFAPLRDIVITMLERVTHLSRALPSAILSCGHTTPALLRMFSQLSQHAETVGLLASEANVMQGLVHCMGARNVQNTVAVVLFDTLMKTLEHEHGCHLLPLAERMVEQLIKRYVDVDATDESKPHEEYDFLISNVDVRTGYELRFVVRASELVFAQDAAMISSKSASLFAGILLSMVRNQLSSKRSKPNEEWIQNVLKVYRSMVWRVQELDKQCAMIAPLFCGALYDSSAMKSFAVRFELVSLYQQMAKHPSLIDLLGAHEQVITDLNKRSTVQIEGKDVAAMMDVLNRLASEDSCSASGWNYLLGPQAYDRCSLEKRAVKEHVGVCGGVIYEVVNVLFEDELYLRRAAVQALVTLLRQCALDWAVAHSADWVTAVTAMVMPCVYRALRSGDDAVMCSSILLLSNFVQIGRSTSAQIQSLISSRLCLDLGVLTHSDPEQDFFQNIVHIQMHRRGRAMLRVTQLLEKTRADGEGQSPLQVQSMNNVLVPIIFHYLVAGEFEKKLNAHVIREAVGLLAAMCAHLPWRHYFEVIKRIMRLVEKSRDEKQRILQTAFANILENFHFPMLKECSDTGAEMEVTQQESLLPDEEEKVDLHRSQDAADMDSESQDDVSNDGVADAEPVVQEKEIAVDRPFASAMNAIGHVVMKSLVPWLRANMMKKVHGRNGEKEEEVQPILAMAFASVLKRLEAPLLSSEVRIDLFSNVVIRVVNTLKSRDVGIRDGARACLANMIKLIGMQALKPVVFELQSILTEGYQRYIQVYSVRSILGVVTEDYSPPIDAPVMSIHALETEETESKKVEPVIPAFDCCLRDITNSVLLELTVLDKDVRDGETAIRSAIREMKGSKFHGILEIIGSKMLFRPTYALVAPGDARAVSSIHAVVGPLLDALQTTAEDVVFGRTAEALQRLAAGLTKNPSVQPKELLLYIYATLQPFVTMLVKEHRKYHRAMGKLHRQKNVLQETENDLEFCLPSYFTNDLSEDDEQHFPSERPASKAEFEDYTAATWLPHERKRLLEQKEAIELRNREARARIKVQDGVSAPKLTGRLRYDLLRKQAEHGGISKATTTAIKFCLTLFYSSIKKGQINMGSADEEIMGMLEPFVPLLQSFLHIPGASDVVVLSLKSASVLLSSSMFVSPELYRKLARQTLCLLLKHGGNLASDQEIIQCCVATLAVVFKRHNDQRQLRRNKSEKGEVASEADASSLALSLAEMRSLIEMITVSLTNITTALQTSSFQLIEQIIDTRVMVPEIYDLMVRLGEQIVLSHRQHIRELAASVVIKFLVVYPMKEQRRESQMKQLINQCDYELEEGRLAALRALQRLMETMPKAYLLQYTLIIFLQLALKLVNESSDACRQLTISVLSQLLKSMDDGTVSQCLQYSRTWFGSLQASALTAAAMDFQVIEYVRIGAQTLNIMTQALPQLGKRAGFVKEILSVNLANMRKLVEMAEADAADVNVSAALQHAWNALYHSLCLLEMLYKQHGDAVDTALMTVHLEEVVDGVSQQLHYLDLFPSLLSYPHSWVVTVTLRILCLYCDKRRRRDLRSSGHNEFLLRPGALLKLSRKVCYILQQRQLQESAEAAGIAAFVSLLHLVIKHPDLTDDADAEPEPEEHEEEEKDMEEGNNGETQEQWDAPPEEASQQILIADESMDVDVQTAMPDNEAMPGAAACGDAIMSLFRKLRALGSSTNNQRSCRALQVFLALVRNEAVETLTSFIPLMMDVIARGTSQHVQDERRQTLAHELLQLLEGRLGEQHCLQLLADAQQNLMKMKQQRKAERKALAVRDPKAFAHLKIRKRQRVKEGRQRALLRSGSPALRGKRRRET